MAEQIDNEGHAEAMDAVEQGHAVIASDQKLPGGRFQVTALVMGGELILTEWRQDDAGDWHSTKCLFLQGSAIPSLVYLLNKLGYTASGEA